MDLTHLRPTAPFIHCQEPLIPVEDNAPLYVQLYNYNLPYAPQRQSERNENLVHEIIINLSGMLAQCNPFAHIYRHAYEILKNHEGSSINSEDESNNDSSTKSGSSYIIISPSMRMRLIEGDDRHTHSLPTMEEAVAVIVVWCGIAM
ncbi:hypothetical protein BCV71DRAFT_268915 [Rhizopus microsporus]|uniref:Uncharacterized protein n=1 Tax=Rhizopus microsporus TaxID=58291 RepID=A0A1X0RLA6_RHIZD|nr:hypothetical protein BCV71DRAFT_268915 [Rhizopus microsporus]